MYQIKQSPQFESWLAYLPDRSIMKTIRAGELLEFDIADQLNSAEDIAEYLTQVLEENDPAEVQELLGVIARSRGMTEVARSAGLTREALYKALRADSHPQFDTILKVCRALGIRLVAEVAKPRR